MRALLHENVYCLLLDGIFINQWVKLGAICNCPQIALSRNIRGTTDQPSVALKLCKVSCAEDNLLYLIEPK